MRERKREVEIVGRFRKVHPLETLSDKNSGLAVAHTPESQRDQKVSRPPGEVSSRTSCRLEMSRAILRTSRTRDKKVQEPLRNADGT